MEQDSGSLNEYKTKIDTDLANINSNLKSESELRKMQMELANNNIK